jgi:hypothetical protein
MKDFLRAMLFYFAILLVCLGITVPGVIAAITIRWATDNGILAISAFVVITLLVYVALSTLRINDGDLL